LNNESVKEKKKEREQPQNMLTLEKVKYRTLVACLKNGGVDNTYLKQINWQINSHKIPK
jgi:hypothetical protein